MAQFDRLTRSPVLVLIALLLFGGIMVFRVPSAPAWAAIMGGMAILSVIQAQRNATAVRASSVGPTGW